MELLQGLELQVPVICGYFGKRQELLTFQTQIFPDQIIQFLGHDPRSKSWKSLPDDLKNMYQEIQRNTKPTRLKPLEEYIQTRMGDDAYMMGAFPAICIGMTHAPMFVQAQGYPKGFGTIALDLSPRNRRILLDGLARVTAALTLIDQDEKRDIEDGARKWFSFPVTIYAPHERVLTLAQLSQLFHDFNFLQTRIALNHAIALDQSDLYIQLTNKLGESDVLQRYGGMEQRRASLPKNSTAIVVQQVLLRFVRGACEGHHFQTSNHMTTDEPFLTNKTFRSFEDQLTTFLEGLTARMGKERFEDRDALHLTSPGWQVLGLLFHDLYIQVQASEITATRILDRLGRLDWSRYNPDWIGILGEEETDKDTGEVLRNAAGQARVKITRLGAAGITRLQEYVYEQSGMAALLAERAAHLMAMTA